MALDTANARPGGTGSIAAIHRYPVKSLTAERLERAVLAPGAAMPGDRRFALLRPGAPFDPLAPAWLPKRHCFALVKEERLAQLAARFEAGTGMLTIERDGRPVARGDATSPVGRGLLEQFFQAFLALPPGAKPRLAESADAPFADQDLPLLSILNLASVRDLERVARAPVDPLRFRANLHVDGLAPWAEHGWIDRVLAIGAARLTVIERIGRCAAIDVVPSGSPGAGARDLALPRLLSQAFGHCDMGVFAKVSVGGEIAAGAAVAVQ